MHVHIVGVSGTLMASLAGLLVELGHAVSGSDTHFDPPMGPLLAGLGVRCDQGYAASNLMPQPDLVIVGNVCRKDNPEAVAAFDRGLEVIHVAAALKRFALEGTVPLVVAGTHGKTTTTALCAWLLEQGGLAPGFLVGGVPKNFGHSFRAARPKKKHLATQQGLRTTLKREPFVIEGDEYDTAYFEKTPKFIHYGPQVAILTSIEHDHIDIYPDLAAYTASFRHFIGLVPEDGLIVANAGDALVVSLVEAHARARVSYFAVEGDDLHGKAPHWFAAPVQEAVTGSTFDLFAGGVSCGRLVAPLCGRHNLRNVVAAIAAAAEGFDVRLDTLRAALPNFSGVKRRQELLGTPDGVFVYDDFAHHPTAVRETLRGLRARHRQGGRLLAIFEPRSATACRRLHQDEYAASFTAADRILLAPLGRELPALERLDREAIAAELRGLGRAALVCENTQDIVADVRAYAEPGDIVVVLSNGAFGGIHGELLAALGSR